MVSARAVPSGVVLQVRNVLTNLVDITARLARMRAGVPLAEAALPPRSLGLTSPGDRMDALALILTVAAMAMFAFAASGRELRRFNEIAVGLVFLSAPLICQFTSITNTHIGR